MDLHNRIELPASQNTFEMATPPERKDSAATESTTSIENLKAVENDQKCGKLTACTQVLVAFLLAFNTFGYVFSFGFFQTEYADMLGRSFSDLSFIGSFQIFLPYFLGSVSGRALDAGYFRPLIITGCILQILGVFGTASSSAYWQFFLAQGVVQGIGNGLLFTPLIYLMSTTFPTRTGLAIGIAGCGVPVGGLIFPLVARQLAPTLQFGWTIRIFGFICMFNSILILTLMSPKSRTETPQKAPLLELRAFKERPYLLGTLGTFLVLWGLQWVPFYITVFATEVLGQSEKTSLALLMILNGAGIPGRILPLAFADRCLGPLITFTLSAFIAAILLFAWIGVTSLSGLVAWAVVYSFWTNCVQTMPTAWVQVLTEDYSKLGARLGMLFTVISFACLTGPPIAGSIMERGGFLWARIFAGTSTLTGVCLLLAASISHHRRRRRETTSHGVEREVEASSG